MDQLKLWMMWDVAVFHDVTLYIPGRCKVDFINTLLCQHPHTHTATASFITPLVNGIELYSYFPATYYKLWYWSNKYLTATAGKKKIG